MDHSAPGLSVGHASSRVVDRHRRGLVPLPARLVGATQGRAPCRGITRRPSREARTGSLRPRPPGGSSASTIVDLSPSGTAIVQAVRLGTPRPLRTASSRRSSRSAVASEQASAGTGTRCPPSAVELGILLERDGQRQVLPAGESENRRRTRHRRRSETSDVARDHAARGRVPSAAVVARSHPHTSQPSVRSSSPGSRRSRRASLHSSIRWIASQVSLAANRSCRPRAIRACRSPRRLVSSSRRLVTISRNARQPEDPQDERQVSRSAAPRPAAPPRRGSPRSNRAAAPPGAG